MNEVRHDGANALRGIFEDLRDDEITFKVEIVRSILVWKLKFDKQRAIVQYQLFV
jgi:hypothetical protein